MPSPQHPIPFRMRAGAAILGAATALCLTACGPGSDTGSADSPTASASPAPKAVVDHKTAGSILDHYQEINNKANKTRDASLLATVEAGQLYTRSKADYEQFDTLSAKEKKDYGTPFYFTRRSFYIPPTGNWFAAEASTNGTNHTFMIFEKSADTGGTWKKVISLFPQQPLPTPRTKGGLAVPADADNPVGSLAPSGVTSAVEDLFASGGTKDGSKLSHANDNARAILKTYKKRGDDLGSQATVNFFPITPAHNKTYTLTTSSGVLAITSLAHKAETLVTNTGLQITPGKAESVYNKTPRAVVVDSFQGEAVVHLRRQSKPEILDYRYALVDSR